MFGKNALPQSLSAAFPGLEIENGKLIPRMGSPYSPPAYLLSPVLNQLLKLPTVLNHEVDSFVVIDTATPKKIPIKVPMVLLSSTSVTLFLNDDKQIDLPYKDLLGGKLDFIVTPENLLSYLKNKAISIFIGYFIVSVIHDFGMLLFSVFFLAFAAFIFRVDRKRKFKEYLKVAVYAVSPIVIGGVLVALAGVQFQWIWHILIFLSTVVMFRAIVALNTGRPTIGENS